MSYLCMCVRLQVFHKGDEKMQINRKAKIKKHFEIKINENIFCFEERMKMLFVCLCFEMSG